MTPGWGVAGCGWVARDHALPALAEAGLPVVAVHDRDPAALARVGVPGTTDLEAFLRTPGLSAVYVAAPNAAHRPLVEAAVGAGLPVLCEKPLAADVADAEAMVRAAERAGVLLGTAYDQRWHPAHRALAGLVASGELGTVTAVRIAYACWLPSDWSPDGLPHDNWRVDPVRAGGGAAIDLAPHGLDLSGVLLGGDDVVDLRARLQHRVHDYARRPGGVDDAALLSGVTADGVLVDLHVSYSTPDAVPRRRLEVLGTAGLAVATDTMGQTAGGSLLLHGADGTLRDVPFDGTSPFAAQFAAFSAALDRPGAWPYDAARDLRLHRLLLDALSRAPVPGTAGPRGSR